MQKKDSSTHTCEVWDCSKLSYTYTVSEGADPVTHMNKKILAQQSSSAHKTFMPVTF